VLHVDSELVYEPFYADFGPLNAGQTFRFCAKASAALKVCPSLCLWVASTPTPRDTAACLYTSTAMLCFCIPQVVLKQRWPKLPLEQTASGLDRLSCHWSHKYNLHHQKCSE
jgi:hypothetical protein